MKSIYLFVSLVSAIVIVKVKSERTAVAVSSLKEDLFLTKAVHKPTNCPPCRCVCPITGSSTPRPSRTCGVNERHFACKSYCDEKCPNQRDSCIWEIGCNPGCRCLDGFVRIGSQCVPESQCTTQIQCPQNEVYTPCMHNCDERCEAVRNGCIPNTICRPGCRCKDGFSRMDSGCVPTGSCPQCASNEIYVPCVRKCNELCQLDQAACLSTTECTAGCTCRPGFARMGLACVALSRCPTRELCGPNKVYNDCFRGDLCMSYCQQPTVCTDRPQTSTECRVGCFCQTGFRYVNGTNTGCVQQDQCPGGIIG